MNLTSLLIQIFLALIPWCVWAYWREPGALLGAWLTYAGIMFLQWIRSAQRSEVEALTKWLLSTLFGTILLGGAIGGPEALSRMFWPLDAATIPARLQLALGSACSLVGSALLLGWPPLQQGWPDLWETGGRRAGRRAEYIFLYMSLLSMLWLLSPLIEYHLPLASIAVGLCGLLCLGKLVLGVQMSIFRSLGYGLSAFAWPLLLRWGIGPDDVGSVNLLLAFQVVGLVLFLRVHHSFKGDGPSWQWDDAERPSMLRERWMSFLYWDFLQILLSFPLLYGTESYGMLVASLIYAICHLSILRDPRAFRGRVPVTEQCS